MAVLNQSAPSGRRNVRRRDALRRNALRLLRPTTLNVDLVNGLVYRETMTVVNVQEAKTQLSRLLTLVEAGEEVVIARYGQQIARLVRVAPPAPQRRPGAWQNTLRIAEDFNEALGEEWFGPLDP